MEDAGRGYRVVVASPMPQRIRELETIKTLVNAGHIVITCGGGGIPVISENGKLVGVNAVIDKDNASSLLAAQLGADYLVILTAVEKSCDQLWQRESGMALKSDCRTGKRVYCRGTVCKKVLCFRRLKQQFVLLSQEKEEEH